MMLSLVLRLMLRLMPPPSLPPPGSRLLRHALAEGAKDANLHDVYLHVQARRL